MIKEHAPPIINNIKDVAVTWDAIEPELEALRTEIDKLSTVKSPDTENEKVIARLEKLYKIMPYPSATIDERRAVLKAALYRKPPFSENKLRLILAQYVNGEDGYRLEVSPHDNSVSVRLAISEESVSVAREMIRQMIPANMVLVIDLM